jgi:uncharacterized protein
VKNEAALLKKFRNDRHLAPTPDMDYQFVGHAPENLAERPLVVGFGPCGIFAALVLAQMGFRPIVLERGKAVRERTQDTWGLWRKHVLNPESNVQFGEGGAGTFLRRQALQPDQGPAHLGPQGADRVRQGGRAGRNPLRVEAAHRHLPPGRHGRAMRHEIEALGGEIRFQQRVTDVLIEDGAAAHARRDAGQRRDARQPTSSSRSATARATPSRCCTRGVYMEAKPSPSAFASSIRSR